MAVKYCALNAGFYTISSPTNTCGCALTSRNKWTMHIFWRQKICMCNGIPYTAKHGFAIFHVTVLMDWWHCFLGGTQLRNERTETPTRTKEMKRNEKQRRLRHKPNLRFLLYYSLQITCTLVAQEWYRFQHQERYTGWLFFG